MKLRRFVGSAFLWIVAVHPLFAQSSYERPPKEILDVLDAPALPIPFVSPSGNALLLGTPLRYPPISDLAEPLLRVAGVRINPRNNGVHGSFYLVGYSLKKLPDGPEVAVPLPTGARLSGPRWNPSGSMFAVWNMTETSVELWVLDVATAKAKRIDGVSLNPVLGYTWSWMPDGKTLLVKTVPGLCSPGAARSVTETGDDVLIGIIDSGFDLSHPAFRDTDGNLRVEALFDQTTGRTHRTVQLEHAWATGQMEGDDTNGHGTHVASIAAGSRTPACSEGIAPRSRLLLVKTDLLRTSRHRSSRELPDVAPLMVLSFHAHCQQKRASHEVSTRTSAAAALAVVPGSTPAPSTPVVDVCAAGMTVVVVSDAGGSLRAEHARTNKGLQP